jgi:hypothetical protein
MLNKRGYSYGAEFPYHFECRGPSHLEHAEEWFVFHAGTDEDVNTTGLRQWDAARLCEKLNEHPAPSDALLNELDATP